MSFEVKADSIVLHGHTVISEKVHLGDPELIDKINNIIDEEIGFHEKLHRKHISTNFIILAFILLLSFIILFFAGQI